MTTKRTASAPKRCANRGGFDRRLSLRGRTPFREAKGIKLHTPIHCLIAGTEVMSFLQIRLVSIVIVATTTFVASPLLRAQETAAAPEQEFIAILQSDAPAADKALACKSLAVHGSEAAVPELAKLLAD